MSNEFKFFVIKLNNVKKLYYHKDEFNTLTLAQSSVVQNFSKLFEMIHYFLP